MHVTMYYWLLCDSLLLFNEMSIDEVSDIVTLIFLCCLRDSAGSVKWLLPWLVAVSWLSMCEANDVANHSAIPSVRKWPEAQCVSMRNGNLLCVVANVYSAYGPCALLLFYSLWPIDVYWYIVDTFCYVILRHCHWYLVMIFDTVSVLMKYSFSITFVHYFRWSKYSIVLTDYSL
jgi:hypothetical protein